VSQYNQTATGHCGGLFCLDVGFAVEVVDPGVEHVAEHEGGELVEGFAAAPRVQERSLVGHAESVVGQFGVHDCVVATPAFAVVARVSLTVVVVHLGS